MTDESVFAAALAIGSPSERTAFLDRACAGNPELRREVDALLSAHAADNPLDRPPPELERTSDHAPRLEADTTGSLAAGDRVGPYKLLERIGEGGMGEVWVADQQEPLKRRVALKLIKPGMDSRSVLARFEAERQALAVMDHPNIAKVLDAGTTPDGRPYFVMELVKGTPITEFCDKRKLTPKQRLELFVAVCQAIQHAHMKGIIHRDIKPTNVLVALHDETPVPKVIDFGVAKAIGQQLTEKTIYTGFGALVGTPAYMAPEQATFNQLDVDTRADVYALGVLLYELLAGSPPFEPERLKKAALDEVLRIVRDEEPPRPSHRLSTSQARATIAATRQSDPVKLSQLIRGELDWIVMKALEKDRTRRYDTANALAKDVQRYLAGDAVEACPPTLGYRLRKVYRKNRVAVLTGGAFAAVLLTATGVSLTFAVSTYRAEQRAEQDRVEAVEAGERERQERVKAEQAVAAERTARRTAERTAASLRIDAELALVSAERFDQTRPSVLRLARAFRAIPAEDQDLRDFAFLALLHYGQDYALLRPPITHNGLDVVYEWVGPGAKRLLTEDAEGTVRLWDVTTGRTIAVLRREGERVVNFGFSRDGRTAWTDELIGVVRLWDASTGRFLSQTEPRHDRYPAEGRNPMGDPTVTVVGDRVLTCRVDYPYVNGRTQLRTSKFELWDVQTGRLVSRLPPSRDVSTSVAFSPDGGWLIRLESDSVVCIHSAEDGRPVGRIEAPVGEKIAGVIVSPDRRHLLTLGKRLRSWRTDTWQAETVYKTEGAHGTYSAFEFVTPDLFRAWAMSSPGPAGYFRIRRPEKLSDAEARVAGSCVRVDDRLFDEDGNLYDGRTGERIPPPPGRRYHPELIRFATDGRFVVPEGGFSVLDPLTDKRFDMLTLKHFVPELGYVDIYGDSDRDLTWSSAVGRYTSTRLFRPSAAGLKPDLVELWAQVVVCGELADDGTFVKWDEPTWERKRQELAAKPVPWPEFPFPGHVATNRLHWLEQEVARSYDPDAGLGRRLALARELVRRAESIGDAEAAARWRRVVARHTPELAPPPREVTK